MIGHSMSMEAESVGSIAQIVPAQGGRIASISGSSGVFMFRPDEYGGPSLFLEDADGQHMVHLKPATSGEGGYVGNHEGVAFALNMSVAENTVTIRSRLSNERDRPFSPRRAGLRLGLDTYQHQYPEWMETPFPTLLRCERTHFWGYFMTPTGSILGIASPDPIASWRYLYNAIDGGQIGHRIYGVELDFLTALTQPPRHPDGLAELAPGESLERRIDLLFLPDLDSIPAAISLACDAPSLTAERYTLAPGEATTVRITSPSGIASASLGDDELTTDCLRGEPREQWCEIDVRAPRTPGNYALRVAAANGKLTELDLHVRRPWSSYLEIAREAAISIPQKASTHCESWYGHFSSFLARKHMPDPSLDAQAESNFRSIYPLMFDSETDEPIVYPGRIQNTSTMISMLVDLHETTKDTDELERAERMADWLIANWQHEDGSFRNEIAIHYTAVIYVAKSLMELVQAERALAAESPRWRESADRHRRAVGRAIDDLVAREGNVETEGEMTFEDGMISCASLQIAMFALDCDDESDRNRYLHASRSLLDTHRCLEQLAVPDSRMFGCSLRFWEAQYDVLIPAGMMTSPHGWSSWKTYATYYLYLLTGEERFLRETMDTLGGCVQVVDPVKRQLRWAFAVDPCIEAPLFVPADPPGVTGVHEPRTIGEQYVEMVSDWFLAPDETLVVGHPYMGRIPTRNGDLPAVQPGGCGDNDVHEHFKCLEEVALTAAYVIERPNGQLKAWNCSVERLATGQIKVAPYERLVSRVHLNLRAPGPVVIEFEAETVASNATEEMQWVTAQTSS